VGRRQTSISRLDDNQVVAGRTSCRRADDIVTVDREPRGDGRVRCRRPCPRNAVYSPRRRKRIANVIPVRATTRHWADPALQGATRKRFAFREVYLQADVVPAKDRTPMAFLEHFDSRAVRSSDCALRECRGRDEEARSRRHGDGLGGSSDGAVRCGDADRLATWRCQ